jgi:hypothetical protein
MTDLSDNATSYPTSHTKEFIRQNIETFIRRKYVVKMINEPWYKFFFRLLWQRTTSEKDLTLPQGSVSGAVSSQDEFY